MLTLDPLCVSCQYGEVFSHEGVCICDNGFELDESSAVHTCIRCEIGQDSRRTTRNASGSGGCTMCAEQYYRPHAHLPATECMPCDSIYGVSCSSNTSINTLGLNEGFWRHSGNTLQIHRCRFSGSWTPCRGGTSPGYHGDGYCERGHHGVRCERCGERNGTNEEMPQFFDKLNARCQTCEDSVVKGGVVLGVFAFAVVLGIAIVVAARLRCFWAKAIMRQLRRVHIIWQSAGMRYKIKLLIGAYQCIAAVPTVFNLTMPRDLDAYARWVDFLEWPSLGLSAIMPAECFGSYETRLLVVSCWPIVFLLGVSVISSFWELWWQHAHPTHKQRASATFHESHRAAMQIGLQKCLPMVLLVTFCLVPSMATHVFKTFLCQPIEYDTASGEFRRYLHDDVALSCDSAEYVKTRNIAIVMIAVWPVG